MSGVLDGRVAVITGSSRGLGREFALRLAEEGAAVVVSGKSETEPAAKGLTGTIHSVAAEIAERGGRALAVRANVREEADVRNLVEATVAEFGRLDILVNNAGALWWERVVDTPPNRVALMFDVNLRASYLATYYALPHMIAGGWGHVVMNSPPIVTTATPTHAMYNCMKMGMSRLAIGVAAEHLADNVAANSLWPATPIDTAATRNWPAEKMGQPEQWRTPQIMCDALMEILRSEPATCTGRQLIDEELLRERGWSEQAIDAYWAAGSRPEDPLWIDDRAPVNRVVVIVGGAAEVGHACGLRAAGDGALVLVADEDAETVEGVVAAVRERGGEAIGAVVPLDDLDALRALPRRLPAAACRVDTLVNCQYTLEQTRPSTIRLEVWERALRTNLTGALVLSQAFLPLLERSECASIVNVGSVDGILGNTGMPAYSASKAGLLVLTQLLAAELGPRGIRANYVARTGTRELLPSLGNGGSRLAAATPLGRLGTADEVALVVEFLASAAASYVNGAVLKVDGGRTCQTHGTAELSEE